MCKTFFLLLLYLWVYGNWRFDGIRQRAGAVQNTWGQIGLIVTGDMSLVGDDVISRYDDVRLEPDCEPGLKFQRGANILNINAKVKHFDRCSFNFDRLELY